MWALTSQIEYRLELTTTRICTAADNDQLSCPIEVMSALKFGTASALQLNCFAPNLL